MPLYPNHTHDKDTIDSIYSELGFNHTTLIVTFAVRNFFVFLSKMKILFFIYFLGQSELPLLRENRIRNVNAQTGDSQVFVGVRDRAVCILLPTHTHSN